MSEISMYEAQKKKMQGLCDEHDLVYRFEKDRYPIIFTIKPVQGMDAQISMLDNVEEVGYRSPDASMSWIFEDGGLDTKVSPPRRSLPWIRAALPPVRRSRRSHLRPVTPLDR